MAPLGIGSAFASPPAALLSVSAPEASGWDSSGEASELLASEEDSAEDTEDAPEEDGAGAEEDAEPPEFPQAAVAAVTKHQHCN